MANYRNTDDQCLEAAILQKEHGTCKAARIIGVSEDTVIRRIKEAARRGLLGFSPTLPGFEIKETTVKLSSGDKIRQVQEAGPNFELPTGHTVKGISAYIDADGRTKAQWIKTKTEIATNIVEALKEEFKDYSGLSNYITPPENTSADILNVYPIADQHNGLMAWGEETGESYDLKIGADRLLQAMSRLVGCSPRSKSAIILNLGDWQHTDNQYNVTPANKNPLDVDSRYFKILRTGVKLMMDCIELALERHETVLVRNIPGNHDPHASVALTVALSAFYSNNPRVTVDLDPSDFFFYRFGKSLIGATHGHKLKPDQMAMLMANARPDDWAAALFRYFYFGHIHHITAKETGGVICESFQSLAAKDAWSHGHGHISGQSLSSITHHIEDGEISRQRINIKPTRNRKG